MITWSLVLAIIAVLLSFGAWMTSIRQADAAKKSAHAAERSAIASEQNSKIASDMKEITKREQELTSECWLAANKPWIRITFPDYIVKTHIDGKSTFIFHNKADTGAPQLICIENIGRLPCRLIECWLDDETRINPSLVQSSIATHRMAGFLEGAAIAHDEAQIFQSPELPRITKAHQPGVRFLFKLIYEYEPGMQVILKYSAVAETPPVDSGGNWVNLVLIESTRDLKEEKRS